jgi:hypothetical protein
VVRLHCGGGAEALRRWCKFIVAVAVLSKMMGSRAKAAFRRCLNSQDEMVSIAAINAIAAGKLTYYIGDLEKLAKNSKSEAVRVKAAQVAYRASKALAETDIGPAHEWSVCNWCLYGGARNVI